MLSARIVSRACVALACFIPVMANAGFQADDIARQDRLTKIAAAIARSDSNSPALLTEAMSLCGISIWNEDHGKTAEPKSSPKLGLAVTDVEVKNYLYLYQQRHSVQLNDLCAGFDVLTSKIDFTQPSLPFVQTWLREGTISPNASIRSLTFFIQALSSYHGKTADHSFEEGATVDPIQALLIMRVVGEEIAFPIRKYKAQSEAGTIFAVINGAGAQQTAPEGWSEDAFVGGVTGLAGTLRDKLLEAKPVGEKIAKGYEAAGAASTIAKAIATYTFLKGEITVKEPGQPLVRTKDTSAGEKRTLVAKFYIDGSKATDWMKDHRQLVALAGLDIDMPKTGPLSGLETNWEINGDGKTYDFNSHIVKWAQGSGDVSKVKMNDNGEAIVSVEGAAQRTKLNPNEVKPVEKQVFIKVTPQVKGTEIKQDLLDAVTGAIGIRGGAAGWITPVIESLYRMKWKGSVTQKLMVKDWVATKTQMHLTVEMKASGTQFLGPGEAVFCTINRVVDISDMLMETSEPQKVPEIPAQVLAAMTQEQIAQMKKAMEAAGGAMAKRRFQMIGPGTVKLSIDDRTTTSVKAECGDEITKTVLTRVGSSQFEYPNPQSQESRSVSVFMEQGASGDTDLVMMAIIPAHHTIVRQVGKKKPIVTEEDGFDGIFDEIQPINFVKGSPIKINLKAENTNGREEFHGATTLKFKFGPNNQFEGSAIVSVSIVRPATKK